MLYYILANKKRYFESFSLVLTRKACCKDPREPSLHVARQGLQRKQIFFSVLVVNKRYRSLSKTFLL